MMNDSDLVRRMQRIPSIELQHLRGVIHLLEFLREDPAMPVADELAALDLVAQRASETWAAINRLGWHGEQGLSGALGEVGESLAETVDKLKMLIGSAHLARGELEQRKRSGRPTSSLSHVVNILADLVERGGGKVDATQGGELCQAFGVVIEAAGLSVANHRETVRAALKRRTAKQ